MSISYASATVDYSRRVCSEADQCLTESEL